MGSRRLNGFKETKWVQGDQGRDTTVTSCTNGIMIYCIILFIHKGLRYSLCHAVFNKTFNQ